MKVLLGLIVALGFANAHADGIKTVKFYYQSFNSFYRCSYAEGSAANDLKKLGAGEVKTSCTGGIDDVGNWLPIRMTVSFVQNASQGQVVQIRGSESCDFNVKLLDAILTQYDHKALKKQESCWDSRGSYRYDVQLN